jgi:hypothetical protein
VVSTPRPTPPDRDTWNSEQDGYRLAYWVLLFFTVVVAVVTFLLSFSGLDDYGRRVARLGALSPLVPLGVDGLTLCAVAATFILRRARFQVRLYAWCVFATAVAASVAGNLSHAAARHLRWDGMIGAAAWPILLALASHLVIVTRRATERSAPVVAVAPTTPVRSKAPLHVAIRPTPAPHVAGVAVAGGDTASRTPDTRVPTAMDDRRAEARRRYLDGESCTTIAREFGCDRKTIERYTVDLRHVRAARRSRTPGPTDQTRSSASMDTGASGQTTEPTEHAREPASRTRSDGQPRADTKITMAG